MLASKYLEKVIGFLSIKSCRRTKELSLQEIMDFTKNQEPESNLGSIREMSCSQHQEILKRFKRNNKQPERKERWLSKNL